MKIRGFLAISTACAALGAKADTVTELRCLEAAWQSTVAEYQENRDAVWAKMTNWLQAPAQQGCRKTVDDLTDETFSWQCSIGSQDVKTTLQFRHVDREYTRIYRWDRIYAARSAAFDQISDALSLDPVVFDQWADAVFAADAHLRPEHYRPPVAGRSNKQRLEQHLANFDALYRYAGYNANPIGSVGNEQGLFAHVKWPDVTEAALFDRVLHYVDTFHLLQQLEDPSLGAGQAGMAAADRFQEMIRLSVSLSNYWIEANSENVITVNDAPSFALFDQPRNIRQTNEISTSVYDTASFTQTTQGPFIVGGNQLVFYYLPQPNADEVTAIGHSCERDGTFPCPPLGALTSNVPSVMLDPPEQCETDAGCRFTSERWINDHVAVVTHLQAREANEEEIVAFANSLLTLTTRSNLTAFEPQPDFDPMTECAY
ncbi:hypothetical protein [Yoonia sp. BS5-3]|uniref:Uncharacterized protein n=1 Tax=Yoonia phaeophyticola TaxID=3137369 RepID=A0ABZ2UZN1_9RHOB